MRLIGILLPLLFFACTDAPAPKSKLSPTERITGKRLNSRNAWDRFFDRPGYVFGTSPTPFLREIVARIPKGKALVLAMGEGRDAVYLAKKGFHVTGIDISEVALRKARRLARESNVHIETINANLKEFKFPEKQFDLIVNFVYFRKTVIPRIKRALKPGGYVVFQNFTEKHIDSRTGFSIPKRFFVKNGSLEKLFSDFEIKVYREGLEDRGRSENQAHMASLFARRSRGS